MPGSFGFIIVSDIDQRNNCKVVDMLNLFVILNLFQNLSCKVAASIIRY